jgi:glucose-6-phosphate isomerase
MSLRLDLSALKQLDAQGSQQALHIDNLFAEYQPVMAEHVRRLWSQVDKPGAFCRWLTLYNDTDIAKDVEAYAKSIDGKFDQVLHIGIGGSALGPAALMEALCPSYWNELSREQRGGRPRLYVIDNVDSDKLASLMTLIDFKHTLIHVVTKSGGTMETLSAFLVLKEKLEAAVGKEQAQKQIVVTTDPEKGMMRELAIENNWQSFPVQADVGGRFSIFSPVGLLPAALLGISPTELLNGIRDIIPAMQSESLTDNIAAQAALLNYVAYRQGKVKAVFMPYSAKLALTADWFVQLWAESLGKRQNVRGEDVYVGQTPIRAVGATDQHSQLQLFNEGPFDKILTLLYVSKTKHTLPIPNDFVGKSTLDPLRGITMDELMQAEGQGTRDSLVQNHRQVLAFTLDTLDTKTYAQLLYVLQIQTALAGFLLDIDPFDQPGVELSKKLTVQYLAKSKPHAAAI